MCFRKTCAQDGGVTLLELVLQIAANLADVREVILLLRDRDQRTVEQFRLLQSLQGLGHSKGIGSGKEIARTGAGILHNTNNPQRFGRAISQFKYEILTYC